MQSTSDAVYHAERALARMGFDLAQIRAENRRLRRLAVNRGHGRIVARARDDCLMLLTWRFAGYLCTRRACEAMGLSNRRWEWARALAWAARVHDGDDFTEDDFDAAVRAIERTAKHIMTTGDMVPLLMRRRRRDGRRV